MAPGAPDEGRTLHLGRDGGARYLVEFPGAGEVHLRARAGAAGELHVQLEGMDPRDGRIVASPSDALPTDGDSLLEWGAAIPARPDLVHVIEIGWTSTGPAADGDGDLIVDTLTVAEQGRERPPSIVFVSIDTLAAGHTSLHGYARETTPRLDAFAADAVVFERCLANARWTTPSYVSQLTGLHPLAFEVDEEREGPVDAVWNRWYLPEERWTLAEMLRAAGYRTAAFVDNPMVSAHFGFDAGFDLWDESAAEIPAREPGGGIRHIVPRALDWIDRQAGSDPFFLFVQAFDVHAPYVPDAEWAGRFAGDGLGDPERVERVSPLSGIFDAVPSHVAEDFAADGELPEEVRTAPIVEAYDEEILALDDALGGFLDELRSRGLMDELVVVVSADHGESMLEHGSFFGHMTVYDEVLHVPLVLHLPGGERGGTRVEGAVQLLSLYPTLAELAGLDPARESLHGPSLLRCLEGEAPTAPVLSTEGQLDSTAVELGGWKLVETKPEPPTNDPRVLMSWPRAAAWLAERFPDVPTRALDADALARMLAETPDRAALRAEFLDAICRPFHELYHLPDDPGELHDLAAQEPERLESMLQLLEDERARRTAARIEPAGFESGPLPDELRAELEDVGYLGNGEDD